MSAHALPVYLTPEQHAALKEAAHRRGSSMTELVRELIDEHVVGDIPPTDLSALVGAVDLGRRTDIATQKRAMLEEALDALR